MCVLCVCVCVFVCVCVCVLINIAIRYNVCVFMKNFRILSFT